ncbi:MAG: peptide-methionine (S)-S-oxide reductase MsrA [Planctomycetes bacterium]|nr:peptide-methionine (S)-S-oxide reductase MsrA [Planctomycetota bacterium]
MTDRAPRRAVFAAGCFWCVEGVFERLAGVLDAESGYAGGSTDTADYESVCGGDSGHAEVVRVTYDPTRITFGELLRVFFATHDPTQRDRQGPDVGTQYRSSVFWVDEAQRAAAEAYLRQLEAAKVFPRPIATRLEPLEVFHSAEGYHQDYVRKHPENPYIRAHALPKVAKLASLFPERLSG